MDIALFSPGYKFTLFDATALITWVVSPSEHPGYWNFSVSDIKPGVEDYTIKPVSKEGILTALRIFHADPDDPRWFAELYSPPALLAPPLDARPKTIYFIGGGGMIKIGHADDVIGRFEAIQVCSPIKLIPMGILPAGRFTERELHARFGHLRSHNEWFHAAVDLVEFIRNESVPWPIPSEAK